MHGERKAEKAERLAKSQAEQNKEIDVEDERRQTEHNKQDNNKTWKTGNEKKYNN